MLANIHMKSKCVWKVVNCQSHQKDDDRLVQDVRLLHLLLDPDLIHVKMFFY